jgi:predicted SprT family Zn-dependent metalloprotease
VGIPKKIKMTPKISFAKRTALGQMKKHGLIGWLFAFNSAKSQAGICYHPTSSRPGRIELSIHFCENNSESEILDIILHEIAHAIVGHENGHNKVWKNKCLEIGAKPDRLYKSESVNMLKGKYTGTCPKCNKEFSRFRKPIRGTTYSCKKCGKDAVIFWYVTK